MSILYPGDRGYEEALERGAQREIDILEQQIRVERSAAEVQQRRAEAAESQRDHALRMVDGAMEVISHIDRYPCPDRYSCLVEHAGDGIYEPPYPKCFSCHWHYSDIAGYWTSEAAKGNRFAEDKRACWSDYLDAKAKEATQCQE